MTRCEQLTVRGDRCEREAVLIVTKSDETEEAYCTQHANFYGAKRRKWRPIKS